MNKIWVFIAQMLLMFCWSNGQAVEFTVTTTDDTIDANVSDGLCLDNLGECSLRAAIMQSNILGTDDVIYLPRGESFVLTRVNDIDTQGDNDLDVWDSLTLSIADPELPIASLDDMPWVMVDVDGAIEDRVFEIHAGELISFKGIVVAYGDAHNSLSNQRLGGGIYVAEQVAEFHLSDSIVAFNQAGYGAGIYSDAAVTLIESTDISYNSLDSPALPLVGVAGAGIFHGGLQLTLNKSSIHHNLLEAVGFFTSALEFNAADSQVNVLNTLVADNGVWPFGSSGVVDGIRGNQVEIRLNNSNITGNTGVGIRFNSDAEHTLTLRNSVLAFNVLNDCDELTGIQDFGGPLNPAHIISSDSSCLLPSLASNIQNVDPNLSELEGRFTALNFQFFSTQYPNIGSVLIDAGSRIDVNSEHVSACESTDIRGVNRPLTGGFFNYCDVGIYESDDLIFRDGYEIID